MTQMKVFHGINSYLKMRRRWTSPYISKIAIYCNKLWL
jgi:hypothetical protein